MIRHGLDEIIFSTHFFRPYRFFYYLAPWNWFKKNRAPRAVRIRRCLEDLGPIFVKLGQILSTRRDLLADDIADELAKLQDSVPPFSGDLAFAAIEKAYRKPIEKIFSTIDKTPLASASVAQVHAATLLDGKTVVVKVIRPDIEPVIRRDISLMYYLAKLAKRYSKYGKRLRPVEVVREFEKTILGELDLVKEAANASQLRRNFENNTKLYVPEIYWPLATRNVLTLERIHGIPISDLETLKKSNIDIKQLAENGVEIFYTQVFQHNFFHADMHPGNIFVADDGQYIAVDFGIMGTLSEQDQHYLAENFVAFFNRDYHRVAELYAESGWIPENTRIDDFEAEIRAVCEPNFNKPLKEISFAQVLLRLFDTARRFDMEVQPQLVLLQKTLLNIEGLGRQLYPDLDLWKTAKPFLENWMKEQFGLRHLLHTLKKDAPLLIHQLPELPLLFHDYLRKHAKGTHEVNINSAELKKVHASIRQSRKLITRSIFGATLVILSTFLFTRELESPVLNVASWSTGVLGLIFLASSLKK